MHYEFKLFTKKLFIFFAICLLLSLLLQIIVDNGLRKTSACAEWNDLFGSKINSDLLIQGSSRAWVHISPKVIEEKYNVSAYNLGLNGYNFTMQYYRLKAYLKYNKKPKYIIQSVDTITFQKNKELYEIEQFYPYLDDPVIREAVGLYAGLEWVDYHFPSAKYRHTDGVILKGIKYNFKQQKIKKYKGFEAQEKVWDESFAKFKKDHPSGVDVVIDRYTSELFEEFLKFCKNNEINIVLVYTPEYIEAQKLFNNRDELLRVLIDYSNKYNVPFLDYSGSNISFDTKYFYNSQHLNSKGVKIFNEMLVADLQPFITR